MRWTRRTVLVLAVVAAGLSTHTFAAGTAPRAAKVTPSGVGGVRLGATFAAVRGAGLVGRQRRGCPLDGVPSAALRAPLRGFVDLSRTRPRRVTRIFVTKGATARGVRRGSTLRAIRRAFPRARVVGSPVAGATLVRIPRNGGGRIEFLLSSRARRVIGIGVPAVPFCE